MTELQKFIKERENWEKLLTASPYNLKVKRDGKFILFKYDQLNSDMSLDICKESRGIILDNGYNVVCYPFRKFFNYGEANADTIDWSDAFVTEKMDGSLVKVWCHEGEWHLSTNNTIDAFRAPLDGTDRTFGSLFEEAVKMPFKEFAASLNKNGTYMFELTHPLIGSIVPCIEPQVYFIGYRDIKNEKEREVFDVWPPENTEYPRIYHLSNIKDVKELVDGMDESHEGVVVCDADFHRIKVKSPEYLQRAFMYNNGILTIKRVISMYKEDQLDDYLAYCPQRKDFVDTVLNAMSAYLDRVEEQYQKLDKTLSPKEYAITAIAETENLDYMIRRKNGVRKEDYWNWTPVRKIKSIVEAELTKDKETNQ